MRLLLTCLALLMMALGPASAAGTAYCRTADCCEGHQPCALVGAGCAPACALKLVPAEPNDVSPRFAATTLMPILAVAHRAGTSTRPPQPPPRLS